MLQTARRYPLNALSPGDSFIWPWKRGEANRIRTAARLWCNRNGYETRFRVLVVRENGKKLIRCWRLPDPIDPDAVTDAVADATEQVAREEPGPISL